MLSNCGAGEDSWESLGQQGDPASQSQRKLTLNTNWKDWYWSWSSNPVATWWEQLIHWKRPWCWERLTAKGEVGSRGWDGWITSPTPGVYSNSCPLSQWFHPTISSSVIPFSSCPQSFPATGSFLMYRLFALGGQSIGALASVLPMNIQDWIPLGWTGWISLLSKGLSRVFSNTTVQKHQFFNSAFFIVQLSHPYTNTGKTITLTRWTFVGKVMPLLFNMLSRLVIAFLTRSKHLSSGMLSSKLLLVIKTFPVSDTTTQH